MTKKQISIGDSHLAGVLSRSELPTSISFELTARCNNNCRHCYINLPSFDEDARRKELSLQELEGIADQAVSRGVLWCLLSGGEPLLREDFSDIYLMLKRKGLLVSVFTNACLIERSHLDLFKRYPAREIEITVYGVSPDTYEQVTGARGSYAKFREGLGLLLDNQVPVSLKAVAIRSNLHEIEQIGAFCSKHSSRPFRFDPFLHLRYDGDEKRNRMIRAERLTTDEIIAVEQGNPKRKQVLEKACREPARQEYREPPERLFTCGILGGSYDISYDGMLSLCGALTHPDYVRDLRAMKLADAYEEIADTIKGSRSNNSEFQKKCSTCGMSDLCFFCPANTYLETGSLDTPVESFCKTAHARLKANVQ